VANICGLTIGKRKWLGLFTELNVVNRKMNLKLLRPEAAKGGFRDIRWVWLLFTVK
jgi:hypothetical protein